MDDPIFLQDPEVQVTKTRVMVPGQTYAVNGITSVATSREDPKRTGAIVMIVIGVLVALAGFSGSAGAVIVGLLIVGVGVLWFRALKPTFHLVLTTAAGEKRAWSTRDGDRVGHVVEAINQALVARG